jgi:hypothetical protein
MKGQISNSIYLIKFNIYIYIYKYFKKNKLRLVRYDKRVNLNDERT